MALMVLKEAAMALMVLKEGCEGGRLAMTYVDASSQAATLARLHDMCVFAPCSLDAIDCKQMIGNIISLCNTLRSARHCLGCHGRHSGDSYRVS